MLFISETICYNYNTIKEERDFVKGRMLLMNDMPGYGKVALASMLPVLTRMGYHLFNLPTALVSNTLDFGKFQILDTTDYMKQSMSTWTELGFTFECICTGFIASQRQVQLIADYCEEQKHKGSLIVVDPIMGDGGKLYHGMTDETVESMRKLCSIANIILPNFTEACFLVKENELAEDMSRDESEKLLQRLRDTGAESIVVTSASIEGQPVVYGYDSKTNSYFTHPFKRLPGRFPGTGDLFSSLLTGTYLSGCSLSDSVKYAVDMVQTLLVKYQDRIKDYKGIPIELYLEEIVSGDNLHS
jgi:pyridoxine kinase